MDGKCVDVVTTEKAKLSNNSLFIRRSMFKVQPLYILLHMCPHAAIDVSSSTAVVYRIAYIAA